MSHLTHFCLKCGRPYGVEAEVSFVAVCECRPNVLPKPLDILDVQKTTAKALDELMLVTTKYQIAVETLSDVLDGIDRITKARETLRRLKEDRVC